jgi:4-amino-4-deoxy-L-arabinose transferase-like glycosyltransferase
MFFENSDGGTRKNFVGWLLLACAGQAASLQMIDAGRLIHFQHYKTLPELLAQNTAALVVFALQIGCVGVGIARYLPALNDWRKRNFKARRLIFAAFFLTLAGAAVTPDASIYATSLLFAAVAQFINLANLILIVQSFPEAPLNWLKRKVEIVFSAKNSEKPSLDRFSLLAAVWVVLLAGFLSYFVYENHPHVPDETQYLFQAHYFAAGKLTTDAPPVPEAFALYMTPTDEARWFSIFPPGWAALLAFGVKFGAVWLINPLLGGLCVLLAYLFFQEIYTRKFARFGVALLCCSPWFVFMAMSFMSHVATLACALGAAVFLLRAFRNQKTRYVFAAGILVGFLSLIRPLDGAMIAFLLGVWTLFKFENRKAKLKNAFVLAVGTLATAALIFPYNKAVTGSATVSPSDFYYTKYFWSGVMAYGFGESRGFGWGLDAFPGHSPLEALINAALNTFLLNTELFGWACGSLIFIIYIIFSGNLRRKDFWALAAIGIIIVGYGFFWYHGGPDFGARYWFLAIIPLITLTVRGVETLGEKSNANDSESNVNTRVCFAVVTLCAMSLLTYFPWRATDKYFRYLEMQPGILRLARENNFGKSLVLIRGAEHPDYQSAWIYNPLDFAADAPVYAHDKSPEIRARLLQAFPERPVWIVDGPTRAGGVYKIAQGPVKAEDLAAETNQ